MTFAGSKPAGSIAAAWAVMRYLGEEGYVRTTKATMDATMRLIRGINAIPGLKCLEPNGESPLYAFLSTDSSIDIMAVADQLQSQGWYPGRMRDPLSIHQSVNPVHLKIVDEYLADLRRAVTVTKTQEWPANLRNGRIRYSCSAPAAVHANDGQSSRGGYVKNRSLARNNELHHLRTAIRRQLLEASLLAGLGALSQQALAEGGSPEQPISGPLAEVALPNSQPLAP